jgi:hypothetical protein
MPFPETVDELVAAGYRYSGPGCCRGCGMRIVWWMTPMEHSIPLDVMPSRDSPVMPHHATCAQVEQFRK